MGFTLHPQLSADTVPVGDLPLCRVLLMNHAAFPWLILVPRVENARELFDLTDEHSQAVMAETRHVSQKFAQLTEAHKINVAALGNMVPQLHIHIIARYPHDAAWPQPVWNYTGSRNLYDEDSLNSWLERIRNNVLARDCEALTANITKM